MNQRPGRTDMQAIAEWCARIPELRPVSDQFWRAEATSAVSYPEGGHSTIANVEAGSYWFGHRNNVIAAMVGNHPPAGPIVDVGGGNGFVSLGLARAGFQPLVIEPGAGGAGVAAERGLPVVQAAFQDLSVPPGSMPAAGLFDVLEHIEDDAGALAGLHQALQPGGMLYLTVPAYQAMWSEEDNFAGHFRRYTLGKLRQRVSEAGFECVFGSYFFSALLAPILLLRVLPERLGRRPGIGDPEQQHTLPDNAAGRAFHKSFAWEQEWIKKGRSLPFGASCVMAARKV